MTPCVNSVKKLTSPLEMSINLIYISGKNVPCSLPVVNAPKLFRYKNSHSIYSKNANSIAASKGVQGVKKQFISQHTIGTLIIISSS